MGDEWRFNGSMAMGRMMDLNGKIMAMHMGDGDLVGDIVKNLRFFIMSEKWGVPRIWPFFIGEMMRNHG